MMRRVSSGLLGALTLLAAPACVDDPVQPDQFIPLSEAEAELLGLQVFREALLAGLAASPGSVGSGPARAPVEFFAEDSATVACPLGGSLHQRVTVSGHMDDEAGVAELDLTLVQTHVDCQVEEEGVRFHLDGAPDLTLAFSMLVHAEGSVETDGRLTGGVTASVGYRSETCSVDVEFMGVTRADGSSTYSMTGTVCGEQVSQTLNEPS